MNVRATMKMFLLSLAVGGTAASCSKETAAVPASEAAQVQGSAKSQPRFLMRQDAAPGTFKIYEVKPTCYKVYGDVNPANCEAPNALVMPTYLRLDNSTCTIDAVNCRIDRGATLGTWSSQWYLIVPQFGPAAASRKCLKFRVKNVNAVTTGGEYNRDLQYNGATNTWSTLIATGSGLFEVEEITGVPANLCSDK